MAIANVLLLSQAAGYLVAFVLSMCAMVPMFMHEANFKGHCLLYTTGVFKSEDGKFEPIWSSSFYCGFTLVVSIFMVILSFVQFLRMSIFMSKRTDRLVNTCARSIKRTIILKYVPFCIC